MRTVTEIETSVPAFLGKLWKLVEDPETDDLICWAMNGRSFYIRNPAQFARELLPHYYKHNNMASFVRQLNMYGFHKKVSVELGGLKCERDEMEFAHQYFIKGHPYLLEHIKRKIATSKTQDTHPPMKTEMMNKVLAEVRTMRGRQEHLDSRLGAMKRENEALWRELAMLRRKHLKQQEIVNKLIHFLVTIVQPSRNGGLSVKRRFPLMIDAHQRHKHSKTSKPEASPTGPVIHELHESDHDQDLDSQYIVAEMLENHASPAIQSPESIGNILDEDPDDAEQYLEQAIDVDDEEHTLHRRPAATKRRNILKPKKKEETLMLDLNSDDAEEDEDLPPKKKQKYSVNVEPIAMMENNSKKKAAKPVPIKTVRSSKLAAMAANINNHDEQEDSEDIGSDLKDDSNEVNFDDILILPELNEQDDEMLNVGTTSGTKEISSENKQPRVSAENFEQSEDVDKPGSSSKSRDLSLSCVNSSAMSDSEYRLGSTDEMGSHLDTMQNELENLRDVCRRSGLDASTLFGLFGTDDPMSFGYPMNPELDPTYFNKDNDDHANDGNASGGGSGGGELMAYNPTPSLLDFDDMFLDAENPSPGGTASSLTECYNQDPLNLEDSKSLLINSLLSDNNANQSASS